MWVWNYFAHSDKPNSDRNGLGIPLLAREIKRMDYLEFWVYGIEDGSEQAAYVVGFEAKSALVIEHGSRSCDSCLSLVTYLSSVKYECLSGLSAKDHHFVLIDRQGSHWERFDKVRIADFHVCPLLFCQWVAVFARGWVRFQKRRIPAVEHAHHDHSRQLRLVSLLSRHQVHFCLIHDTSCRIGNWERKRLRAEPMITHSVIGFAIDWLFRTLREASQCKDKPVMNESQWRTKPCRQHLFLLGYSRVSVYHEAVS